MANSNKISYVDYLNLLDLNPNFSDLQKANALDFAYKHNKFSNDDVTQYLLDLAFDDYICSEIGIRDCLNPPEEGDFVDDFDLPPMANDKLDSFEFDKAFLLSKANQRIDAAFGFAMQQLVDAVNADSDKDRILLIKGVISYLKTQRATLKLRNQSGK